MLQQTVQSISSSFSVDHLDEKRILQFDLDLSNAEKWGDVQPHMSVIVIKNGVIVDYNIRFGEVKTRKEFRQMRQMIHQSRPPSLDCVDDGDYSDTIVIHARMDEKKECSPKRMNRFLKRIQKLL